MIDENKDYVTKSKRTITEKILSKYNDRSRYQPNKQTNRFRDTETVKNLGRKIKRHTLNRHTSKLIVDIRTKRGKQKMKNEALCSVAIERNEK